MTRVEELYKEWQSLQPVADDIQAKIDQKFMLEFNYNSNHIEGNTLTYGQTELLLMFGKVDSDAKMHDLEEMKAHNVGLKMMQEEAKATDRPLTEYFIRELHRTLLREDYIVRKELPDGSVGTYTVHAGQYKTRPNSVITATGEKFEYASPEETPALMTDLIGWYNSAAEEGKLSALELASLFHYRYIRIHPFEDGNGRIARLLVNFILLRAGYPMIIVRSDDKDKYLSALNRCDVIVGLNPSDGAHAELEQIQPFVKYMSGCLERALDIRIKAANGKSIEEPSDWRKKLVVNYKNSIKQPERTDDSVKSILVKEFKPLLEYVDSNLEDYYSVFKSVNWEPRKCEYSQMKGSNGEKSIYDYQSVIEFVYTTRANTDMKCVILMVVNFHQFRYNIVVYTRDYYGHYVTLFNRELYYSQVLSEQDYTAVIDAIGNYLVHKIDTSERPLLR